MRRAAPVVLLLLACAASGCEDAKKQDSPAASASAAAVPSPPPKAPETEKPHLRVVLGHFKKPKGLAVEGGAAYVMDAVSGDQEQNEILDLFQLDLSPNANPVRIGAKLRAAGTPLVIGDKSGAQAFFAVGGDKPNGVGDRLMKTRPGAKGGSDAALAPLQAAPKALALADPAVASDGTNLYWLAPNDDKTKLDVMRMPIAGGAPAKIATGEKSARLLFIAADKKYVYWPEGGRIAKAPVGGGAPSEVAKVVYAWAAVSDGNYLYWSDSPGDNMGTLRRAKVDGGAAETLASGFSYPVSLAVDEKSLFFVNYDADDGGVYRVAKSGGSAVTLVRGQNHPKRIALDDRSVYWINVGDGTLARTDK